MKKKILIIGYGIFGELVAEYLSADSDVFVYDKDKDKAIKKFGPKVKSKSKGKEESIFALRSLEEAEAENKKRHFDYVVFSVPVQYLEESINEWKKVISDKSIILDVSSVKVYPLELLEKSFPNNRIIGTHPMFGVPSIEQDIPNLKVVISNVSGSDKEVGDVEKYIQSLGFKTIKIDAHSHDKRMVKVQALTHFVGESLREFELVDDELKTLSYRHLYNLFVDTALNTKELFETIQKYNPYAKSIRKNLIKKLIEIDKSLEK